MRFLTPVQIIVAVPRLMPRPRRAVLRLWSLVLDVLMREGVLSGVCELVWRHVMVMSAAGVMTARTIKSQSGTLGVSRCGYEMLMSSTQKV